MFHVEHSSDVEVVDWAKPGGGEATVHLRGGERLVARVEPAAFATWALNLPGFECRPQTWPSNWEYRCQYGHLHKSERGVIGGDFPL